MTKLSKRIFLFLALIVSTISLASCGEYNFYNDWKNAGANIEEDNVFEVLTLEEIKEKRDSKNSFALIFADSSDSSACTAITKIQEQADAVGYQGKVYFISSKDANNELKKKDEFLEAVENKEFRTGDTAFVLMVYGQDGSVIADSSSSSNYSKIENFVNNTNSDTLSVNYEFLAHYLFSFDSLYN